MDFTGKREAGVHYIEIRQDVNKVIIDMEVEAMNMLIFITVHKTTDTHPFTHDRDLENGSLSCTEASYLERLWIEGSIYH